MLWLALVFSLLAFIAAGFSVALSLEGQEVFVAIQDQIDKLNADLAALVTEVQNAVADIATLKGEIGNVITPAQSAALDAIAAGLEKATSDLKAGE